MEYKKSYRKLFSLEVLDKPQIKGLFSEFLTLKHGEVFKVSYVPKISFENSTGVKSLEKVLSRSGFFCLLSEKKLCLRSCIHRKITDIYENRLESWS